MLADMHAHYPMHVSVDEHPGTLDAMRQLRHRSMGAKLRTAILRVALRVGSDRDLWSGHRVSIEDMRRGHVRVAFSVLYCPEEEFDIEHFGDAPEDAYFQPLLDQMQQVEDDVALWDDDVASVVTTRAELDAALATTKGIALVHCVEGGFHLGSTVERIEQNVTTLAQRGVAYITLAHLFFREVATNSNALPFLGDGAYHRLFSQPNDGLTKRGDAAVRAMTANRVIVDLSHMDGRAIGETLDLLDSLGTDMPVIASHAGYRFGSQDYMLDERTVKRIAERDGVIGLIMAQHQLNDGVRDDETKTIEQSFEVIRRHVERIAELTGGLRHVAIGSDLDGFIKPTMGGIESSSDLGLLEELLVAEYGPDAALVASDNALRVLRAAWA